MAQTSELYTISRVWMCHHVLSPVASAAVLRFLTELRDAPCLWSTHAWLFCCYYSVSSFSDITAIGSQCAFQIAADSGSYINPIGPTSNLLHVSFCILRSWVQEQYLTFPFSVNISCLLATSLYDDTLTRVGLSAVTDRPARSHSQRATNRGKWSVW